MKERTALPVLCGCQRESPPGPGRNVSRFSPLGLAPMSWPVWGLSVAVQVLLLRKGYVSKRVVVCRSSVETAASSQGTPVFTPSNRHRAPPSKAKQITPTPPLALTPFLWLIYISIFLSISEAMDLDSSVAHGICVLHPIRRYKAMVLLFLAHDESGFVFSQF